jgi:hypothetical protein
MGQYNQTETIFLFGRLPPGGVVTIQVASFPGDVLEPLSSASCAETSIPGYYVWDTTDLVTQPTVKTTLLYVMTDADGNQFSGKAIVGGFPEQVKQTHGNVQALL